MLPTKFRFIWPSDFRGEDFKKSANQKQELPMAAMFVDGSGRNEQSLERTFHRCFIPRFTSFSWGVSEEKIKMWKVNGWRTPSDGKSSHCLWQGELKMMFIPSLFKPKVEIWESLKTGHTKKLQKPERIESEQTHNERTHYLKECSSGCYHNP
jgi:hypothetical protein